MSKPREFWIRWHPHWKGHNITNVSDEERMGPDDFHVVEYSGYKKLSEDLHLLTKIDKHTLVRIEDPGNAFYQQAFKDNNTRIDTLTYKYDTILQAAREMEKALKYECVCNAIQRSGKGYENIECQPCQATSSFCKVLKGLGEE